MSLKSVNIEKASFIEFLDCSICGTRFSKSQEKHFPLCSEGNSHKLMSSKEQLERKAEAKEDICQDTK